MAKNGARFSERAAAGCGTCLVRGVFVFGILFVIYMTLNVIGLWSMNLAMLEFLDLGWIRNPASYNKGHDAMRKGQHEIAAPHYLRFLQEEGEDAPEDLRVQAHMDLARIFYQRADSLGPDPTQRQQREEFRQKAIHHCEEVLKIRPGHHTAERMRQDLIMNEEGEDLMDYQELPTFRAGL